MVKVFREEKKVVEQQKINGDESLKGKREEMVKNGRENGKKNNS